MDRAVADKLINEFIEMKRQGLSDDEALDETFHMLIEADIPMKIAGPLAMVVMRAAQERELQ